MSIVTNWDTFHWPGKYPVRKMLLYMYVKADNPTSGSFSRISPVMRSCPGTFVERSLLITTFTSGTVNFLIGIAGSLFIPNGCGVSCLSLLV